MPRTRHSVEPYCFVPPSLEQTFAIDDEPSWNEDRFEHSLFAPIHYEPGYAYPLVVWLHGSGGSEQQLPLMMRLLSLRNYVGVAPRGLSLTSAEGANSDRFGWRQTESHIQAAQQRVFDCVELASRQYHIAANRVFLMGADRSGTMALRIALSHPHRFAGAISLRGPLPSGRRPLGNVVAARRLGIFLGTDRGSQRYPATQVCADLRLLHAAGLSVTLRQYPSGNKLPRQMLADVDRWIIDEINASKARCVESQLG